MLVAQQTAGPCSGPSAPNTKASLLRASPALLRLSLSFPELRSQRQQLHFCLLPSLSLSLLGPPHLPYEMICLHSHWIPNLRTVTTKSSEQLWIHRFSSSGGYLRRTPPKRIRTRQYFSDVCSFKGLGRWQSPDSGDRETWGLETSAGGVTATPSLVFCFFVVVVPPPQCKNSSQIVGNWDFSQSESCRVFSQRTKHLSPCQVLVLTLRIIECIGFSSPEMDSA